MLCVVPASAQYSAPPAPSWYDYGTMRQQTLNGWRIRDRLRRPPQSPSGRKSVATRRVPGATLFRAGQYILPARLAAAVPARRAEVEAWYRRLLDNHAAMARRKGVPTNDVARAASFAVSSLYYVYRDGADLDAAQLDGLRRQMTDVFTHDPGFQRLGGSERQEAYERYVIQGMAVSAIYDGARARGDSAKRREMRDAARTSLQEILGMSAASLEFGLEGVRGR